MKKEQLITDLEEMFESDEKFTAMSFFKDNIGVFLTAVSLVAALLVFGAKTSSYLVDRVYCRYWNLDERFIVEDNKAYLKLGVSILIVLIISISNAVARKYASLWELYDCELYLLTRLEKQQKKKIKTFKREIRAIRKGIDLVEKAERALRAEDDEPFIGGDVDAIKESYDQLQREIKNTKKEYRDLIPLRLKWKRINIRYLGVSLFVVVIASIILQTITGIDMGDNSYIKTFQSSLVLVVVLMVGVLLSSWVDIKFKFRFTLNSFLKKSDNTMDSELKMQIMNLLESKAKEIQNRDLKQGFSDKSCKNISLFALYYVVVSLITFPIMVHYNLYHLDTFYVAKEEMQNYVLVAKFGEDYIFTQCDILDEEVFIDTNKIYVTEEPIKMEKTKFKRVEKR